MFFDSRNVIEENNNLARTAGFENGTGNLSDEQIRNREKDFFSGDVK